MIENLHSSSIQHRIGLVIPSSNTIIEPDFYHHVPRAWSVHSARMYLKDTTIPDEERMLDKFAIPAVRDLVTANPDVIVFGCTSAGALRGNDYDESLVKEISEISGVPTISVIKSVRETLQKLNATRLVVVTPYIPELNVIIKENLENDGFEVLNIQGLGITDNFQIARVQGEKIIDFSLNCVGDLNPDALFISCTNFPAFGILPKIQKSLDIPVVSSNQAALEATINCIVERV